VAKYLVLGGTGTLGKQLVRYVLNKEPDSLIVCFSRDELKQKEMANEFKNNPKISFVLGDIRDRDSLHRVCSGVDAIFHFAALKHIDSIEHNPEESIKTNVVATVNVADVAIQCGVKHVVFSSTDKAVDPINVYGMCKGISEKLLLRRNETQSITRFSVFRWGNVVSSRGSVIPLFVDKIKNGFSVPVTDVNMTRFWIRIESAVSYLFDNYKFAATDRAMIPPIKAASLTRVVNVIGSLLGHDCVTISSVPIRPGEKLHESMDHGLRSDTASQYTDDELKELLKDCL